MSHKDDTWRGGAITSVKNSGVRWTAVEKKYLLQREGAAQGDAKREKNTRNESKDSQRPGEKGAGREQRVSNVLARRFPRPEKPVKGA